MILKIVNKIKNNRTLFLLSVIVLFQILIIIFVNFGQRLNPMTANCQYADYKNPVFLWNRANFDGVHYLSIAQNGYSIYQQAFFPLYPLLIKLLTPIFSGKDLLAGLFVSFVSLFGALYFLYKLVLLDYKDKIAQRVIFFLLIFPTSFFFTFVYTESLFLVLIVGSFYFARTKNWLMAGIFASFASATRLVGIFLLPALLFEFYEQNKTNMNLQKFLLKKENIYNLLFIGLGIFGLLGYMIFLQLNYNDPIAFIHAQAGFGNGREVDRIILFYQVVWRYMRMIFLTRLDPLFFTVWLELLSTFLFLTLLIISFVKKVRKSYLLFAILSYIIPTFSGTFSSMPRYVLVLFPCFISLGLIENKYLRLLLSIIFLAGSFVTISLFVRGYFVS